MSKFEGVFPAVPTPFEKGGETINERSFREILDFLIGHGVHGLFVTGVTGEGPLIPPAERKRIIDIAVEQTAGRAVIIIQSSNNLLPDTLDIARHAVKAGVDGIAVLSPWFFGCDDAAVIAYIQAVSEAIGDTPLFLYNIPGRTGNPYSFQAVQELRKRCGNIRGIKESGSLVTMAKWYEIQDEKFRVFCGIDQHEYDAYRLGGLAIVAAFANWLPETFVAFHKAASAGNWEEARRLQNKITNTVAPAVNENLIANIKAGLRMKGIPAGWCRPPLRDLSKAEEDDLRRKLVEVGFLSD
ncbi:MAG: dihydrodipicolinate synthase family protein [Candidatus Omnitrophota bacterium]